VSRPGIHSSRGRGGPAEGKGGRSREEPKQAGGFLNDNQPRYITEDKATHSEMKQQSDAYPVKTVVAEPSGGVGVHDAILHRPAIWISGVASVVQELVNEVLRLHRRTTRRHCST
jgi:hypothetical protein